jgi:hypothetical protein
VEVEAIHGLPKTVLATGAHTVCISDRNDRLWSCSGGAIGGPSGPASNDLGHCVRRGSSTSRTDGEGGALGGALA